MAIAHHLTDALGLALRHWLKLLLAVFVGRAIYRRYFHPLRNVPGPWLASITGLWFLSIHFNPQQHWIIVNLHRKYGPIVRIGPNKVIFTSPDTIGDYYGWDKSRYWKAFQQNPHAPNHGGFLTLKEHRVEKSKIMGAYTLSQILKSEEKVDGHVLALMEQFSRRTNAAIDLAPCKLS
jgi:hypothetical protein